MFTRQSSSRLSHPQKSTLSDEHELRYWCPDRQWYHPLICGSVVQASRLLLGKLNQLRFEGKARWDNLFEEGGQVWRRADGRGLLSFSNHVSLFDDPLLISNLGARQYQNVRWIAADHINFFGNRLKGMIYSAGKCVPIIRGGGLSQPGFDFLIERLKSGEWVHIFPEGGRTRDPQHRLQLPLKVGVGKLICEARPVVMPFYHDGMHRVLPIGHRVPRLNQEVIVQFGESTVIDDAWSDQILSGASDDKEAWRMATEWVRDKLLTLERGL